MTHNSKQVNALAAYIADALTNDQIIAIHNEFCDKHGDPDDIIFQMGEYSYICGDMDVDDLARMQYYGEFNPNDDYFCFDGRGNLASFNSYDDDESPIYLSELADYVIEYGADDIESNDLIPAFLEFAGIEDTDTNEIQIGDALFMSGDDLVTADWDELKKSLYLVEFYISNAGGVNILTVADNDQTAIERVMAYCQNEELRGLYVTCDEYDKMSAGWTDKDENETGLTYIDPTLEDSQCTPAYFDLNTIVISRPGL